jgi:hypothetical protein
MQLDDPKLLREAALIGGKWIEANGQGITVASLFRFHYEAKVIAQANDTEFGLASYFYTQDLVRVFRVSEALDCSIVGVNIA